MNPIVIAADRRAGAKPRRGAWRLVLLAALSGVAGLLAAAPDAAAAPATLSNDRYTVHLADDGAVLIGVPGLDAPARFEPRFTVLFRAEDPNLALRPANIGKVSYPVPTWRVGRGGADRSLARVDTDVMVGDGFDHRVLRGDQRGRTVDLFAAAGELVTVTGRDAAVRGDTVTWRFETGPDFELTARLSLPKGEAPPALSWRLTPRRAGWYSVGYTGAPAAEPAAVEEVYQPLIWNYDRVPKRPFLTLAFRAPAASALVRSGGVTLAVAADSEYLPFTPLPTSENSQFGVLVRDEAGGVRPMCFAPAFGGTGSRMAADQPHTFTVHLIADPRPVDGVVETIARRLYDFRDLRRNGTVSMNTTLTNMIAYGLSEYNRFNEDLRGCAYSTDVPGSVKNVSALHPLAAAMVTDDPEIYTRRARPIIEFLLSREKFLFVTDPSIKGQNPSWRLFGPAAPLTELTALYQMTQRRNPLLLALAQDMLGRSRTLNLDVPQPGDTWTNRLALYRATGDPRHLEMARRMADAYIAREIEGSPPGLDERGGFFWNAFVPPFYDLLELHETTGEPRYLELAHDAARDFAQFIWVTPSIPDHAVTVNEGGVAPVYWYLASKGHRQMRVPEERVPAWRVSEIGLTSESTGTSAGHRGILLANHAPWFLRIAHLTGDGFLHDLARHAIVGRYANFPGYHINTARTTVYEKADYPLRKHEELSYNSFHYNHVWPHVALLIDYLVSDAVTRSGGRIDFPSRFAEGYAYLKNKVYGDRSGRFYDDEGVWLWMPAGLLEIDDIQLNYIAARGNGKLYVALTNQSFETVRAQLRVSDELVGLHPDGRPHAVAVRRDNGEPTSAELRNGRISVEVSPQGLTTLVIEGVRINPSFQRTVEDGGRDSGPGTPAYSEVSFGEGMVGMLLSMGPDLTSGYIYLKGTFETIDRATLHYRVEGGDVWQRMSDAAYPFEFTVELPEGADALEYFIETTSPEGRTDRSEVVRLTRS